MKLGGVNIKNIDTFKEKFDIGMVWENIDNGMLRACQEEFAAQNVDAAGEIAELLKRYEQGKGLEEKVSACYGKGRWNTEKLKDMLKPLSEKSKDHNGNDFYSRNRKGIWNILEKMQWNAETAALFYIFLLLMLQVKPKEVITVDDYDFICEKLYFVRGRTETSGKTEADARLYPCGAGRWYLRNGQIFNPQDQPYSPPTEMIACFAYTDNLGVLAFTQDGAVSDCTHPNRKYELEEKMKEECGGKKKIIMAAAYGGIYLLLMEDGGILTNVQDSVTGWKDIRWVGAGLNSIVAVKGNNRNLLQIGADESLDRFSGVKAAYTRRTDDGFRYAVLKQDGNLIMEDGRKEEGVSAANISREGYLYAIGQEIFPRNFDREKVKKIRLKTEGAVLEVCRYGSRIYCRTGCAGEQKIVSISERLFG